MTRGPGEGGLANDDVITEINISLKIYKSRTKFFKWPKSNVSKVRAYCSASDHLIRKIFSGVCRDSHWFEEYLKIIEIGDHFFE